MTFNFLPFRGDTAKRRGVVKKNVGAYMRLDRIGVKKNLRFYFR
jgi:hypothetical protein